jgi:2-polyprenyl-6-methoxyphenol hydroxylase-like FAD-dependent oxidoreductase
VTEEVVVVGAGPTGLMLASELALAGVRPVVVEKLSAPTGLSKALGIGGRTVDLLEHRGLYDRFVAAMPVAPSRAAFIHFGGVPLDLHRLPGSPPRFLDLLQARVESLLDGRASELGVEIRRGIEVTALEARDDSVRLTAGGRAIDARFVVGCDGGRSVVRKLAGIDFPGLEPTHLLRLGDVKLPQVFLSERGGGWTNGRAPFVPLGDGYVRVITRELYPAAFDRAAPMTLDELCASAKRVFGFDLPASEPRWLSRFSDASRQAAVYRKGRLLLAGDAAHVHLPAGGPGINLGINDAVNLGWKLAAEVRGDAPEGLLDSYQTERHPAGAAVLRMTRAQSAMLENLAVRELVAGLLDEPAVLRRIVDMLQGNDLRYEMHLGAPHPLVGIFARAQPATVPSTARVRGALVVRAANDRLAHHALPYAGAVDVAIVPGAEPMLLRPDGFVAWAGDPAGLERALARWFPRRAA